MNLPESTQTPKPEVKPFGQLIEETMQKFNRQESFVYQSRFFAYTTLEAAGDVISGELERGLNIDQIFNNLTRETFITPRKLAADYSFNISDVDNWYEFKQQTCDFILSLETEYKHPETVQENYRRMDFWSEEPADYQI